MPKRKRGSEKTFTKAMLLKDMVARSNLSKGVSKDIFEFVFQNISENLLRGDYVNIRGFGKFSIRIRRPCRKYVPSRKEWILVPETKRVQFKATAELKKRVSKVFLTRRPK